MTINHVFYLIHIMEVEKQQLGAEELVHTREDGDHIEVCKAEDLEKNPEEMWGEVDSFLKDNAQIGDCLCPST